MKEDGSFTSSTIGKECSSDLRGAKYTVTNVIINDKGLDTWDHGFNENDKQVWGPIKCRYLFKKIDNFPLK